MVNFYFLNTIQIIISIFQFTICVSCHYGRDASGVDGDSGRLSVGGVAATLATGGSGATGTAVGGAGANAGNEIRFFKNGKDQNVAFSGIKAGGNIV